MKNYFIKPEIEIISLLDDEIICTSGNNPFAPQSKPGDSSEDYNEFFN